jgi:urocanate hydratase
MQSQGVHLTTAAGVLDLGVAIHAATGVTRHVDPEYEKAIESARVQGADVPRLT